MRLQRLARLVLANKIKCNYLPEIRRKPHNFCEPKLVTVLCDLSDNRGNFVNFKGRRYASPWMKVQPALAGKELFAMVDYDDLRTLELVDQSFATFNVVTCEGPWANVPHDQRMLDIVAKRYATSDWNIYVAQASDGYTQSGDAQTCVQMLNAQVMPIVQHYAYIEILDEREMSVFASDEAGAELWRAYRGVSAAWKNFAAKRIAKPADIYPVFRELFAKETA